MGLAARGLQFGYAAPLDEPVDFEVPPGAILGILGPSGCGKSTLLATIAGLLPPLDGQVHLDGADITEVPTYERRIGLMFQEPLLFTHLSALDNVAYGLRRQGVRRSEARDRAAELLDWVGLGARGESDVRTLSGGQAQRVALARALAPEPQALLLDEPFSALDAELRNRLAAETSALLRAREIPVLYVTHDAAEAESVCDRILLLGSG